MSVKNAGIRRTRKIGGGMLGLACLFVVLSAAGVVFPSSSGPTKWTAYFEVGVRTASATPATIAAVADAAIDDPTTVVIVTGHTGTQGDPEANLDLSRERATVIAEALQAAGVPADRIVQRGAGGAVTPTAERADGQAGLEKRAKRAEIRLVERRLLSASFAE